MRLHEQNESEWSVDLAALRARFGAEGADLDDKAFIRDAWENGVREPYFQCESRWTDHITIFKLAAR